MPPAKSPAKSAEAEADEFLGGLEVYAELMDRLEALAEAGAELTPEEEASRDRIGLPATRELLALCRKDILAARVKLATERNLDDQARAELWHIIDAREWVLRMVAKDFDTELSAIERQLEADLQV